MEEIRDGENPTQKIYQDKAIWVGTFIGGPLVAGYFIAENFKAFNDIASAKKTWNYAIMATLIIFVGILLIPESVKIPNIAIPLLYTATAYYLAKHFQDQNLSAHLNAGGELFSWWRVIGVGIIGMLISIVIIVILAILLGVE